MDEVLVVSENDEVLGTVSKAEAHEKAIRHRIAVVYVENDKGEFLVQLRTDGYLDHSAAGHVDPGESYEQAAARELSEELGISGAELTRIGHGSTSMEMYAKKGSVHVFDVFVCKAEPRALQESEVRQVYWKLPEEVAADMLQNSAKYCVAFTVSLPIYVAWRQCSAPQSTV